MPPSSLLGVLQSRPNTEGRCPSVKHLPCPCPKSLPVIDPLRSIRPRLFFFDVRIPDQLRGGTGSSSTCRHCFTPPGIGAVAVAETPVWSCFTLNIYALMPAALTHFPHTAECSARHRLCLCVASYEWWVKGLLPLDVHQAEYHKLTPVTKCILFLLVFFFLKKRNPPTTLGKRLSCVERRSAQKCHRGFRLRLKRELQTTVTYFRFNTTKRESRNIMSPLKMCMDTIGLVQLDCCAAMSKPMLTKHAQHCNSATFHTP